MATNPPATSAPVGSVEQLEEIAKRLVEVHIALASNLDGGREIQTWTRHQIETLMAYVDSVIDGQASTPA